jgi:hypothetical protein
MKSGTITNDNHETRLRSAGDNEALLRSEITFWKDMIAASDPTYPLESMERMQHALALAEWRLATLFREYQDAYSSGSFSKLPSNVYSITSSSTLRNQNSRQAKKQ